MPRLPEGTVRKSMVCATMRPDVIRMIESRGKGDSFSAKLENWIKETEKYVSAFVRYGSEDAWERGEVTILNENAVEFARYNTMNGEYFTVYEDNIPPELLKEMQDMDDGKGKRRMDFYMEKILPKIRETGEWAIQIIEEPEIVPYSYAVWGVRVESKKGTCKECQEKDAMIKNILYAQSSLTEKFKEVDSLMKKIIKGK